MKQTILFVLAALLLVTLFADQTEAQVIRKDYDMKVNYRLTNNGTDTLAVCPVVFNGMYPDSVYARWGTTGSTDSIKCYVAAKTRLGSTTYRYTFIDSITARETSYGQIANTTILPADDVSLSLVGRATGNAAVAANGVKLWLILSLFYHE